MVKYTGCHARADQISIFVVNQFGCHAGTKHHILAAVQAPSIVLGFKHLYIILAVMQALSFTSGFNVAVKHTGCHAGTEHHTRL